MARVIAGKVTLRPVRQTGITATARDPDAKQQQAAQFALDRLRSAGEAVPTPVLAAHLPRHLTYADLWNGLRVLESDGLVRGNRAAGFGEAVKWSLAGGVG